LFGLLIAASQSQLVAATFYPTAGGAAKMVVADMNHDGKPDVLTAGAGFLSVLLNKGDGTLLAHVDYPDDGYFLAVADFNNDGDLDAVTESGATGGTVNVFLGKGDGTLQPPIAVRNNCGIDPAGITTGDFNGDGRVDLAIGNLGPRKLAILLGNGDGSFRLGSCTVEKVGEILAVDINHDGKLDLVGVNSDGQIAPYGLLTLLGNGDGSFQEPLQFDKGTLLNSPLLADVNGDGMLDVVTMGSPQLVPFAVLTFLGRGDGTFRKPSTISSKDYVWAFAVGAFDGDSTPDLLIETNHNLSGSVTFFAGKGDGTFSKGGAFVVPSYAPTLIATDLDGDGKLDVVGTLPNSSQIFVFHGNGDGTFQ